MIDGHILKLVASNFVPECYTRVNWADLWERPLSEGSAFEWTTLAAIAAEARIHGWQVSWPPMELEKGSFLFPLRNEIPRHHGAQPGHSSVTHHGQSLLDRFFQALLPKMVLHKHGVHYSVFREGCPYHKIMTGQNYKERPDILFLQGRVTPGFPKLVDGGTSVDFSFDLSEDLVVSGRLRVINSPTIPCVRRYPRGGGALPVAGIVECSVNKLAQIAIPQLQRYDELFSIAPIHVLQILITGNALEPMSWETATVDLSVGEFPHLEKEFRAAARKALALFAVI